MISSPRSNGLHLLQSQREIIRILIKVYFSISRGENQLHFYSSPPEIKFTYVLLLLLIKLLKITTHLDEERMTKKKWKVGRRPGGAQIGVGGGLTMFITCVYINM